MNEKILLLLEVKWHVVVHMYDSMLALNLPGHVGKGIFMSFLFFLQQFAKKPGVGN